MKKQLLFLSFGIVALLAACSPASITQGTYNGTISAYMFPTTSGNGTATVTLVNDNTVNIKVSSAGNPDVTIDNVNVTKIEVPGVTEVSFSGSNSSLSVSGNYVQAAGVNTCSINIDSAGTSSAYIYFDGSK